MVLCLDSLARAGFRVFRPFDRFDKSVGDMNNNRMITIVGTILPGLQTMLRLLWS